MLDKDVTKLVFGLIFIVEPLEKLFGIANRADDKVAITYLATAGSIVALTKTVAQAGVVRDFAF